MDKKSKIFFWAFFLLIVGSIFFTFWRIIIRRDYIIEAQIDCDPSEEICFMWKCDPESNEDGESCVGDPEKDSWYYKLVEKKAANIPNCNPEEDEYCDPWKCEESESDCQEIFCDEEMATEQEVECSDPEEYKLEAY